MISIKAEKNILIGDQVRIECGAYKFNYSNSITWTKNNQHIQQTTNIIIKDTSTEHSWKKSITFKEISTSDLGVYECEVIDYDGGTHRTAEVIQISRLTCIFFS